MVINFALVHSVPGGPIEQILANLEGEGDVFEAISGGGSETAANSSGNMDYVARGFHQFIAELEKEFGFDKPPLERFLDMMWSYIRLGLERAISAQSA